MKTDRKPFSCYVFYCFICREKLTEQVNGTLDCPKCESHYLTNTDVGDNVVLTRINKIIENPCNCGPAYFIPHEVGKSGCVRIVCDPPIMSPYKKNYWIVDGHEITNTTLRSQRGYSQHDGGLWSRYAESTNSLPDET